jgi:predicted hydrocarbon binding protein
MKPVVPIDVDADTGIWSSDGLPMLYVPRHFFVNNHVAIEHALGVAEYSRILHGAGYQSAYTWCDKVSVGRGGDAVDVFRHYLARLSQRGWGQFQLEQISPQAASASVSLRHSSMVLGRPGETGKLCYMFSGWFAGAMDWVCDQQGIVLRAHSKETSCSAEGHEHCTFTVSARTDGGSDPQPVRPAPPAQ